MASLDCDGYVKVAIELDLYLRSLTDFKKTEYESFDTMAKYFLDKQLEHHKSFLALYARDNTDVFLINRSMIEGYAMVRFAISGDKKLADDWCAYWPLARLMEVRGYQTLGVKDFDTRISELEDHISKQLGQFVSLKKTWLQIGNTYYYEDWKKDQSLWSMIRKTESSLLKSAYSRYSNWHHWTPLQAKETLKIDSPTEFDFAEFQPLVQDSIGVAFYCLIKTASLVVDHFKDEKSVEKLNEFNVKFEQVTSGKRL